ncbi:MAG: hypothetical protein HC926_03785 [Synechococcaceae cyanobacterium SM2_3_60]|nr:hypothetical protein [Synechococcaceae cyanobacterium SM2_3_60]
MVEALALYLRQADSGSITLLIAGFDPDAQSGADGRIFTLVIDEAAPPQVQDNSGFYYRLDGDFDAVTRLIEGALIAITRHCASVGPWIWLSRSTKPGVQKHQFPFMP